MLSFIAISTTYIFGTLLTAKGALKHLNILAFFGVIINIVLNFIMIPESGAEGAALASLITQALTALFQVIIALKLLKISVALRDKISFSLFFILSYCVLLIVPFLSFSWIISLLITFSSLVIISFSTGMISIKYILAIINEKSKSQISNN